MPSLGPGRLWIASLDRSLASEASSASGVPVASAGLGAARRTPRPVPLLLVFELPPEDPVARQPGGSDGPPSGGVLDRASRLRGVPAVGEAAGARVGELGEVELELGGGDRGHPEL